MNWDESQHPRDEEGQFAEKAAMAARAAAGVEQTRVFRGTSIANADKAKTEGVARIKDPFGRPPSVYFMKDKDQVRDYVAETYTDEDEGFAVIELLIPSHVSKQIMEDEEEGDSFRLEMDIPSKWVGKVWYYDRNANLVKVIE